MKKSILIICISIFSLALFGQTPQKADVAPKVDINKTKANDAEADKLREERIKKELKAEAERTKEVEEKARLEKRSKATEKKQAGKNDN